MNLWQRIKAWLNKGSAGEVVITVTAGQGGTGVPPGFIGRITDNNEVIPIQLVAGGGEEGGEGE